MRTTLDIDDDVLQAAKELASREKKTAGRVISDLVRRALNTPEPTGKADGPHGTVFEDGWYVLPRTGGIVTKEMVDALIEEAELEDGRLSLTQRRDARTA